MGHVSNFNGMNCDENGFSQANSDLISADNILESLNENFMPIYNSIHDDVYRHPNLYASSNLTSLINADEDRNGYFNEPLEFDDLLFDSDSFNIDFSASEPILTNDQPILQNEAANDITLEAHASDRNGNVAHIEHNVEPQNSKKLPGFASEAVSQNDIDFQENDAYVDEFEPKSYTAETNFKKSESSDEQCEDIPKLIIRLKPESNCLESDFSVTEDATPMTIADNVKLTRRRNENVKCSDSEQRKSKAKNKHKSHKRKSRHKKKERHETERKIPEVDKNFNGKIPNCNTLSFGGDDLFLNQTAAESIDINDSKSMKTYSEVKNSSNGQVPINNTIICFKKSSSVDNDLFSSDNDQELSDSRMEPPSNKNHDAMSEQSVEINAVDSPLSDFENTNDLFLLSPSDIKNEVDSSADDLLNEISVNLNDANIPELSKSLFAETGFVKTAEISINNSLGSVSVKEEFLDSIKIENEVEDNDNNKSSTVSDLIDELNAHNQQVFEEIEISTPEHELELNASKPATSVCPETSHPSKNSANNYDTIQNKTISEHEKNDKNLQNHLSSSKIFLPAQTAHPTVNHSNSTAQPRNVSSSCSSVSTIKSSTSHRSYRKRRRSSSSSSSSSDREKFYNRPVKYDPVTQTYCDEFGRSIRPNELKYYLNAKSKSRDSHSNNGSSSSSRSKSPRYKSYHRKHHKSRSDSRSHRRRRHSSSRSRSRSHGRKYRDNSDRRYRSPSPKQRSKGHYLDVEENMRAYEERRVMYVGDIPPDYTVEQLKERFSRFGPIQAASIKSKITADGSLYIFGFVTFKNRSDVCQAIERGNENPSWPRFDLNFGGRRRFCNGNYTDLDGKVAEAESGWYGHHTPHRQQPPKQEDDFAELLRQEQRRIGMSKK